MRRSLNNRRRNAQNAEEAVEWKNKYKEQKEKVQKMVKDAVMKHEKKVSQEIMEDKNRSRRIWDHIRKLQQVQKQKDDGILIYDINGVQLLKENIPRQLEMEWMKIYQKHPNTVHEVWNNELRETYENILNEEARHYHIWA